MKKILLFLLCSTLFSGVFAQSFSLSDINGVVINPGAVIQILGAPTDEAMVARIDIKNNAEVAKTVKVKKVIFAGDTLPGTTNSFCWGLCYADTVYISPFPQTIQPGTTNDQFYGDYRPKNIPGISRITYVFFDIENRIDTVSVVVEFNASPASVGDEPVSLVKFSDAYPNPAIEFINVDYVISASVNKASIVIMNMLGSKVKEVSLDSRSGIARIEVADLINGIYFYSLMADDRLIVTRKFVVRR